MDDVAGTKKAKPKLKLASFNSDIEVKIKAPASHQAKAAIADTVMQGSSGHAHRSKPLNEYSKNTEYQKSEKAEAKVLSHEERLNNFITGADQINAIVSRALKEAAKEKAGKDGKTTNTGKQLNNKAKINENAKPEATKELNLWQKAKLSKAEYKKIKELLRERFPLCFTKPVRVPLAIGINKQLFRLVAASEVSTEDEEHAKYENQENRANKSVGPGKLVKPGEQLEPAVVTTKLEAARLPFSKMQLRKFLQIYTSQRKYLRQLVEGKERYNLDGSVTSKVTAEQEQFKLKMQQRARRAYAIANKPKT